jgi:hypothetical protein
VTGNGSTAPVLTDLFGRTIEEVRAAIAHKKGVLEITASYTGNEQLALGIARARANVAVDERQLALLERGVDPKTLGAYLVNSDGTTGYAPMLSGAARAQLHKDILWRARR